MPREETTSESSILSDRSATETRAIVETARRATKVCERWIVDRSVGHSD